MNVSRDGCIIYFENEDRGAVINADGDEVEVFVGGDFIIDGKKMNIDEADAHLIEREYQAAAYLPLKRVPAL